MRKLLIPCVMAIASLPGIAGAGQAEICYTTPGPSSSPPPTNASLFNCPTIGNNLTLPQIAQAGWQVVQMGPLVWDSSDPLNILTTVQLVVQKP